MVQDLSTEVGGSRTEREDMGFRGHIKVFCPLISKENGG